MSEKELMQAVFSFTDTLSQLKQRQKAYAKSSEGGASIIAAGLAIKIKQAQAARISIRSSLDNTDTKVSQFSEWNRFLNEILSNPSIVMNFGEVVTVSSMEEFRGLILMEEV
jgi:chromosome condensin MukBEF ATPase and DNA-binding subunit MukB